MSASLHVFSFYRFVSLSSLDDLRAELQTQAVANNLLGTILLANEGINGSVVGARADIEAFLEGISVRAEMAALSGRWTRAHQAPFKRMRVKLREEIVTMGQPGIDPAVGTGKHVDAQTWNELLQDDEVIVLDTRNDYEIEIGTFPGALDPKTNSFRDFPAYVEANLESLRRQPVAMFCTGGIRCEKASALLLERGCKEVYQLDGGILAYLDSVDDEQNLWDGECFVFDSRVAVDATLEPGHHVQCHACRRPLSPEDLNSELYEEGLSCPACHGKVDAEKLAALRERRKQNALRRQRER